MMINIVLLIVFGLGIYFYKKNATDNLLIMATLALYIIASEFNKKKEHNTNVCSCTNEAAQNIASLAADYAKGTIKVQKLDATDIHINNNLHVGGDVGIAGHTTLYAPNPYNVRSGSLTVGNKVNIWDTLDVGSNMGHGNTNGLVLHNRNMRVEKGTLTVRGDIQGNNRINAMHGFESRYYTTLPQ
jgi:uncharacterized protein (UPF0333 family)